MAVALGGNPPPSDMLLRMCGGGGGVEGTGDSTRMADSAVLRGREVGTADSLTRDRRWPDEALGRFSPLGLLPLSADECLREREPLSLLLQGSTSNRKNLVPAARR